MRLPYRNKKTTLWVMLGIVVVTMFLFKFTELRPICFFRDEAVPGSGLSGQQSSAMMRGDAVSGASAVISLCLFYMTFVYLFDISVAMLFEASSFRDEVNSL